MPRLRRSRSPVHLARRVAAALLAAAALVLALQPRPVPASAGAASDPVVVAAADLPAGTRLTAAHLTVVQVPPEAVPDRAVGAPDLVRHRVLAGSVRRGEPLTDARLVGVGLTTLLPAGQVAAPVRLADLAVAALARAGDRVDVLATPDAGPAERVATGALVLAAPGSAAEDSAGAGLLLLAVDEETAARLAAASAGSTLTLSLPPP